MEDVVFPPEELARVDHILKGIDREAKRTKIGLLGTERGPSRHASVPLGLGGLGVSRSRGVGLEYAHGGSGDVSGEYPSGGDYGWADFSTKPQQNASARRARKRKAKRKAASQEKKNKARSAK